jgi:dipeptidyl aminopeptidase/acylaminoacyl peptidase
MRFMYMSGHDSEEEFDRFIEKFSLLPVAGAIKCPVLIQAGQDDELSPIEFSDELVGKIRSPKMFVIYEGERHAIGGNNLSSSLGENWFTMLADWCLDRIEGKLAPNERVFINSFGQAKLEPYE